MLNLCLECEKRKTCRRLCQNAERWADLDRAPLREHLPKYPVGYGEELRASADLPEEAGSIEILGEEEWRFVENSNLFARQHQCLFLYYWCGINQAGIAGLLGISQPGVSQALKKGRNRLLPLLEKAHLVNEIRRATKNRVELQKYYKKIESILTRYTSKRLYPSHE